MITEVIIISANSDAAIGKLFLLQVMHGLEEGGEKWESMRFCAISAVSDIWIDIVNEERQTIGSNQCMHPCSQLYWIRNMWNA